MRLPERAVLELRRRYHRLGYAPLVRAVGSGALFRADMFDTSHLASYPEEGAEGPLQREEALLLYGAVRALRPRTLVDIGFWQGHSVFNFLRAMDDDATLHSFDISPLTERLAAELFAHDDRFHFTRKSQDEIVEADIGAGRQIDFLFLDASHELELNKRTWAALEELLAPRALVVIHDTGTWTRDTWTAAAADYAAKHPQNWVSEEQFAHRPDERTFVNWIAETRPEYSQIHFHSDRTFRHGLTMLQAGGPLST